MSAPELGGVRWLSQDPSGRQEHRQPGQGQYRRADDRNRRPGQVRGPLPQLLTGAQRRAVPAAAGCRRRRRSPRPPAAGRRSARGPAAARRRRPGSGRPSASASGSPGTAPGPPRSGSTRTGPDARSTAAAPGCPALTRVRSRAARVSRGAPVRRTISSNRRLPRNTSRTASRAHFSPTTSRVRATEHSRGWAACGGHGRQYTR